MFSRLIKELAEKEGITETFKAKIQIEWVQKMNDMRNVITEIINQDLIYR